MSEIYEYISKKIRELRGEQSQEAIAKKLGVATNTWSRWETATYKPTAEDLDRMARFFEVPISLFFPERQDDAVKRVSALTSAIGGLKEEDVQEVINYAQFRKAHAKLQNAKTTTQSKKKRKRA